MQCQMVSLLLCIKADNADKLAGQEADHLIVGPEVDHLIIGQEADHLILGPEVDHLIVGPEVDHLIVPPEVDHLSTVEIHQYHQLMVHCHLAGMEIHYHHQLTVQIPQPTVQIHLLTGQIQLIHLYATLKILDPLADHQITDTGTLDQERTGKD